jgi:hypothetical protein
MAKRRSVFARLSWLTGIITLMSLLSFLNSVNFGSIMEGLTPPELPLLPKVTEREYIEQNWDVAMSEKFHQSRLIADVVS